MKAREWWIFKGTSNFCQELELVGPNYDTYGKAEPEGFYDIISTKDTVEGGIHVREVLPGSITLTREELRAVIIERLKDNTQEMEGYSYYGSNPGVPEDEYGNIADEVIEKVFGEAKDE